MLIQLLSLLPLVLAVPACLRFADTQTINQLFIDGGPNTKVLLCPSKVYELSGTIVFTAANQEIATYGYPTGADRATLLVDSETISSAIQGDCRRCAQVSVRSLKIDGNRQKLGRMEEHDASGLVILGGNEGQSITNCHLRDPRGFTALHVREGDKLSCSRAVVEKNQIGPVGDEYKPEIDGDDPETSPLGRPLADGITIACRDSVVRDNHFVDNSDAAIVVYCSPGTLVSDNHILAKRVSAMAGILMVDASPFDGDYAKTVVKGNIIDAATRTIRIGIGLGAAVLSDDTETMLKGGRVIGNGIKGNYMGYGIVASGLEQWTIKDNWDEANHQGRRSARCFDDFVNPDPVPYLYHQASIRDSVLQPEFVDGEFQYAMCLDGLDTELHEVPEKEESASEEPSMGFSTGSEVMDGILGHSQQRMLETIENLSDRVGLLAKRSLPVKVDTKPTALNPALGKLSRRLDAIEAKQRNVAISARQMREGFKSWYDEYTRAQVGEAMSRD